MLICFTCYNFVPVRVRFCFLVFSIFSHTLLQNLVILFQKMKNLAVVCLLVSLFYILEAGRVRNKPIEFEGEIPENDFNEDLHYVEDEHSSRKFKQSAGVKDDSSFYFKIKQQQVTKTKAGVKKVTKVKETKKVDGQNATSTSFEVIRFPNGTEVIKGKPPMKKPVSFLSCEAVEAISSN